MGRTVADWVKEGEDVILAMLATEHAVVWPEVEARAGESRWDGMSRVDPNHLITARNNLLARREIEVTRGPTQRAAVVWTHITCLAEWESTPLASTR